MKYEIKGDSLPVVICKLNQGDEILTQAGGMSWHTEGITVSTEGRGGLGKMLGRALAGEKAFQNIYSATMNNQEIAFASNFPGSILPIKLDRRGRGLIIQKNAFLASELTVDSEVYFKRNLRAGMFAGEGFVMLKLTGDGLAFLEIDGSVHNYELKAGEKIIVDTGHVVAMETTCSMDIETAGRFKSMMFGGEGLFNTTVTGPGRVYLQSMPIERLKNLLKVEVPQNVNNNNNNGHQKY